MMKAIKNLLLVSLTGLSIVFTITSCQKSFDPKTYAPSKPLPTFGGYSSSKQIETSSLVDYFPFNGSNTDSLGNLSGTTAGNITFGPGVSGKAYQGAAGSYVVFGNAGLGANLQSYTLSFW